MGNMQDKKKHRIIITQLDMIRAQEDSNAAYEIINKMDNLLNYFIHIMYNIYGAKYDNSIEKEDIKQFLSTDIYSAILAYSPEKYDPEKDKTNKKCYTDPFSYLFTRLVRSMRYFHEYHHMKKRIPPRQICSLEGTYDLDQGADEENNINDLTFLIENMIIKFKEVHYCDVPVMDVMEMLFNGMSHDQIAKALDTSITKIRHIVDNIIMCEDEDMLY